MHCSQVIQTLEQALTRAEAETNKALMNHLQACDSCRRQALQHWAQDEQLQQLMAADDIPPLHAGFADQALAQAWETAQARRQAKPGTKLAWGMAASLLLAIAGGSWLLQQSPSQAPQIAQQTAPNAGAMAQVTLAPAAIREVQVRLVSKEALADASISLQLEGDLALSGYPGTKTLQWQAGLAAGINQLALPLALGSAGSQGGKVTVKVMVGNASKSFSFQVQPQALALTGSTQVYLASL